MNSFYLSDPNTLKEALKLTGLSLDELEYLVGRFEPNHHRWPNELKGEVIVRLDKVIIRHHFTKKKLWDLDL